MSFLNVFSNSVDILLVFFIDSFAMQELGVVVVVVVVVYILFIFETEHKCGRDRERMGHRIQSRLQAPSCQHRPQHGLSAQTPNTWFELTNHDIMT